MLDNTYVTTMRHFPEAKPGPDVYLFEKPQHSYCELDPGGKHRARFCLAVAFATRRTARASKPVDTITANWPD